MAILENRDLKEVLEEALWQVEEAKKMSLPITKGMNFINLSRDAQGYGNERLALGLLNKARESLFNDMVQHVLDSFKDGGDALERMKLERTVNEARERFIRRSAKEAYEVLLSLLKGDAECAPAEQEECSDENMKLYSEALDSLQKIWLKIKEEERKGKDMSKAQTIFREAKYLLSKGKFQQVLSMCRELSESILSPQDRLREEVEDTMEEISRTIGGLFPEGPRNPKEQFFKKQIEQLLDQSQTHLGSGRFVEAVNTSRKARELLLRLESESIKGDIPKMIIELRAIIDEIKAMGGDTSYEEYLLKQIEETFWEGEYIKSRKTANKLLNVAKRARENMIVNNLSSRYTDLDRKLKERTGHEGYLQAREFLDKAKILMDESAFEMAEKFMDRAESAMEG